MLIMQISLGPDEWRDDRGRGRGRGARVETFDVSIWPSTLPSPSPISPDCAAAPPPPFSLHKVFFEPDHPFISHQLPPSTTPSRPEVSDTLPPLLFLLPSFSEEEEGGLLAGCRASKPFRQLCYFTMVRFCHVCQNNP